MKVESVTIHWPGKANAGKTQVLTNLAADKEYVIEQR